jgi:hypothetical protein
MRRVIAISLAILIVMLATRGVMAQDSQQDGNDLLLKILKEKNIITDEQLQDIKGQLAQQANETDQQPTALDRSLADYLAKTGDTIGGSDNYVQNQGVTFSSSDGAFTVFFGGLFQFGYIYETGDSQAHSSGGFQVTQNRFDFGGTIFDNVGFYAQFRTDGGGVEALDAYADWKFGENGGAFRVGMFKVPFGRQSQVDASDLEFGMRSLVADEFRVGMEGRDTGVMYHNSYMFGQGNPDDMALEVAAGLWNGSGNNMANDTWLAFGARIGFYPMGMMDYVEGDLDSSPFKLGIAAAALYDENDQPGDNIQRTHFELDFALQVAGVYFTTEFFSRNVDDGTDDMTDTGLYAQAGYFILPGQFEVLGRIGAIDYDNDDTESEWALGAAWYFDGHEWKIIGAVGQRTYDPDVGDKTDDWFIELILQADW